MQDLNQIELLLRSRERVLALIELDQNALARTPGLLDLEFSLSRWRRQLVIIETSFSALTGVPPDQYLANSKVNP
ncbi:TPA: hypothetical protein ACP32N_005037 [Pseudomonas aeruginosa]